MVRKLVLDTETTGISTKNGDRIIEIGIVELIDDEVTDNHYHQFLNPEREISQESIKIHGIENDFIQDKPLFKDIVNHFLEFIQDSPLIIHNAAFDMSFLNYELSLLNRPALTNEIIDTLLLAKQKYPGSPASLNALCRKFTIDLSDRVKHGALLDSELLAQVYKNLIYDATNYTLDLQFNRSENSIDQKLIEIKERSFKVSEEELAIHQQMLAKIPNNLWSKLDIS